MERIDISQQLKWKTTDIFPSDEAWENEFKSVEAEYGNYDFSVFKGKLNQKDVLLQCFRLIDTVSRKIEKLYLYAHLRHDEDLRVSKYTSAHAQVGAMISKIFAQLPPITIEYFPSDCFTEISICISKLLAIPNSACPSNTCSSPAPPIVAS